MVELPCDMGLPYTLGTQIQDLLGGQLQGGFLIPKSNAVVIAFTGETSKSNGYDDLGDDVVVMLRARVLPAATASELKNSLFDRTA